MAYEGYRSPQLQSQTMGHPDDASQTTAFPPYPTEPRDVRPRTGSVNRTDAYRPDAIRPAARTAPINDAVSSAFDQANTSSYGVPPDLVAQITEDVIKRLKNAGLDNTASGSQAPTVNRTSSGSTSPSMPSRSVYTPPSPVADHRHSASFGSPQFSSLPNLGHESPQLPRSPRESNSAAFGDRGPPSPSKSSDTTPKPQRNSRMFSNVEETTLDKIWGTLFDGEGRPLERLDQLLRGLAIHIIEDFKPKKSIVITPTKMMTFYEKFRLPYETYPWPKFFEAPPETLSQMYCDLACQHHLVQAASKHDHKPGIPGLTPTGFSQWMTILLLAHPDEEVDRLQKAIMNLPIDNPDATKQQERFPKEVSRHLFPKKEDRRERSRFKKAAKQEDSDDSLQASRVEKPLHSQSMSAAVPNGNIPERAASIERERKPYSSVRKDSSSDDMPPPISIERERKPYTAQPGGGKTYEDERNESHSRAARANSNVRPPPSDFRDGFTIPENRGHHRTSSNANPPPRRSQSPSFSRGDFRRSDTDILGSHSPPNGMDTIEAQRRNREMEQNRKDWARRAAEDEGRDYDSGRERDRYSPMHDVGSPPKRGPPVSDVGSPTFRGGFEEDYYRPNNRPTGSGYILQPSISAIIPLVWLYQFSSF